MKVNIKWGVNQSSGSISLSLEEMGIENLNEWDSMSEERRLDIAQNALDTYDEIYAIVESVEER